MRLHIPTLALLLIWGPLIGGAIWVGAFVESSPAAAQTAEPPPSARFVESQYTLGAPTALVTVIEYFSDTCPHCAAFDALVFPYIRETYIGPGRVRYIFREALTPPPAISAAGFILARCAGEDQYLNVVEDIFRNQLKVVKPNTSREALLKIGSQAGLTDQQMQDCLSDDDALKAFRGRVDAAVAAGVEGTPTFVFNGHMLMPGERIGGSVYLGGELTKAQFDAAYSVALRSAQISVPLRSAARPQPRSRP